ncbi:hypothetical protein DFQ30_011150 [Apophysomyces sp. BC1015]|nr:hypothetical protein DFQ30_011150 [Apophysomyces sp. BC1015]
MFDYPTLKVIWWVLIGVLLLGFALTDGFDMGVGTLLPFIGKTDTERRVIINAIGPTWEGNQVWLITAGAVMFAAWPLVYAAAFSGFYFAMLLVLFALFMRPVGFEYRAKRDDPRWRASWDWALFAGSAIPALVFGVAFGNLLQGVPFRFDDELRVSCHGGFFALLNPFALLCGAVSVGMLVAHGAAFLRIKTEGAIARRASHVLRIASLITVVLFIMAGIFVATRITGFEITRAAPLDTLANPLLKHVTAAPGLWMANYVAYPWMMLAPACVGARVFALHQAVLYPDGPAGNRRNPDRGVLDVPVHHAVIARSSQQPDAVGFDVEPSDAGRHADLGHRIRAADHAIHQLGLSRDARQGHRGKRAEQPALNVLIGIHSHWTNLTEQTMWYFSWILGVGVALAFGVINAMWLESHRDAQKLSEHNTRK